MALTENVGSNQAAKFGAIQTYTVGSVKIWRGAIVVLRLTDGLAYPAIEDIADTYKQKVIGWALEVGEIGATMRVRVDGKYKLKFPGVVQADVGKLALVNDDETVHTYAGGAGTVVVGRISSIATAAYEVFVDFVDHPVRVASSLYL